MKEIIVLFAIFGLFAFLEIILIRYVILHIKSEISFAQSSEKMAAMVRSVTQERSLSSATQYIFTVDAINGRSYTVSGTGIKASMIKVGDVVEIYVPEGFELADEDPYFESIISGGEKAISSLSDGEKLHLLEYIEKRTKSIYGKVTMIDKGLVPSLKSEGRGLKKDVIVSIVFILVTSFMMLAFGYNILSER